MRWHSFLRSLTHVLDTGPEKSAERARRRKPARRRPQVERLEDRLALSQGEPLEIGDRVWSDRNANGVQDPGEPGIAGVTVELFQNGLLIDTTTTNAAGEYFFGSDTVGGGLQPDTTYEVRIFKNQAALAGFRLTRENAAGDDAIDSDAEMDNGNAVIRLTTGGPGTIDHTFDFGFIPPLSLGNRVWNDLNNNGRRDPDEPGLGGIEVRLSRDDNNDGTPDDSPIDTTTTDADGYYLFTGLEAGTYIVEIVAPAGFISSTGTNASATGPFEGTSTPDPDTNIDDDDNGTGGGGLVRSLPITLALGTEPVGELDVGPDSDSALDADSNLTVDFGLYQPSSLGDRVWFDLDGDGVQDPGEPGAPGVLVGLLTPANLLITTTTTDEDGAYRFTNLAAGSYVVAALPPAGFVFTLPGRGTDNALDSDVDPITGRTAPIDLAAGDTVFTVDVGLIRTASLRGSVYVDNNLNRVRDRRDVPAPGVLVLLTGVTDLGQNISIFDRTGSEGSYFFPLLRPGTYQVVAVTPSRFRPGATNPGTTGGTPGSGRLSNVNLQAGVESRENDFGLLRGRVAGKNILLVSFGRRRRRR